MNASEAREIANAWAQAQGPGRSPEAFYAMEQGLRTLIPDAATCGWLPDEDGEEPSSLLAVRADSLFVLTVAARGDGEGDSLKCERFPIVPAEASVNVTEYYEQRSLRGASMAYSRVRDWSFDISGRPIAFQTAQAVDGGFAEDRRPSRLELLARALAAALGWPVVDEVED